MNFEPIEEQGFNLLEIIDETSQTVAWKAVQRTLERTVILRILKPLAASDPAAVEHFLSIARIVARVKSESVSSIFDIVSAGNLHYLVTEYVEGPTLEELVEANGPLPTERVLRIAASLVGALDLLWESAHVVHRNLKGGTIRLTMRGVAKITDFSLAIQAGEGVNATALDGGNIVGTPCFLSPEQAQGSHTLTTQSDMYALGAVLYYLATGIVPFERQEAIAILDAHVNQQIPPPHHINPSLPASFSWFLRRLMMKASEARYPDWQTVLHDIRFLLSGESPVYARPDDSAASTIATSDGNGLGAGNAVEPQIRLKQKKKNSTLAAYQSKSIEEEHANEIRRATLITEGICWLMLALWLTAVLWFRAVYQTEPERDWEAPLAAEDANSETTEITQTERPAARDFDAEIGTPAQSIPQPNPSIAQEAPPPPVPPPAQTTTPAPRPATPPEPRAPAVAEAPTALPSGIPAELASRLAQAFAKASLPSAREAVQSTDSRFREKDQLAKLLERVPDPDSLIIDYLNAQIGKPLIFERNGKQRTVIPREIANGIIRLEANGRGIDIPMNTLSADERLRWMDRPKDEPQSVAYCLTLMRSSRRGELSARAAASPLLAPILAEAAALVTAQ